MEKKIPIKNIYYMLCYSWDALQEKDLVSIDTNEFKDLLDLFAKVLAGGLEYLIKRGFDRQYIETQEEIALVRGKINVSNSIKRMSFVKGRLACQFDELSYNVLQNQIIKTTVDKLVKHGSIDPKVRQELKEVSRYLREIDQIPLNMKLFSMVHIHRNNHYYRFLLNICEIIYANLLADEKYGKKRFKDFLRDEDKMADLFEKFVRNFYKRELSGCSVSSELIKWDAEIADEYLPVMKTDISIVSKGRKLIIDTKYYKEAFSYRMNAKKLRSENLYQIFAYLKNSGQNCEGIILYPTVEDNFTHTYVIQGHKITAKSINLNQEWYQIQDELLAIVEESI